MSDRQTLDAVALETLLLMQGETVEVIPGDGGDAFEITAVVDFDPAFRDDDIGDSIESLGGLIVDSTVEISDDDSLTLDGESYFVHTMARGSGGFRFVDFRRNPRDYYRGGFTGN